MNTKTIDDVQVNGQKVLVRVDFNVPLKDGVITDDNRITAAAPTIKKLVNDGAKVILFSHLGKVKAEEDKAKLSIEPAAKRLAEVLGQEVKFVAATRGTELETAINELENGQVLMFENTRFEDVDGKKESKNDEELGKYWASLGDGIFVNDAFGTAHRAHASNKGIASNSKVAVAGYLLAKEIEFIGGVVDAPKRPLVAILGGAKVSDKIGVIESLLEKADYVLVGGGMMFTFLKAQGYQIGKSLCEEDKLDLAKDLLAKANGKLILPVDAKVTTDFSNETPFEIVDATEVPENMMGLDVGPKTVELFASYIEKAQTVVWNGPMGVFEMSNYAEGTIGVCKTIAAHKDAITIIGGGDSAAAAIQFGYADDFTHVSTGGGASLEYLEGKELPGVACLTKN
ncbi:MAG: phosphoglycerate kinase [Mycoplasmatales bacterium]